MSQLRADMEWLSLLKRPSGLTEDGIENWIASIGQRILTGCVLYVAGIAHRLTEVEIYYCSEDHPDPFTHCHPLQKNCGLWYFHRVGSGYRAGSFKGLDISFGDSKAFGGILIRGIQPVDAELVDGPSITVDHFLRMTHADSVQALDTRIAGRPVWALNNPLLLEWTRLSSRTVHRSARVGLSLRRYNDAAAIRFIMAPYRFLTEPTRIRKGKPLLVLALYLAGMSPDVIASKTGCAPRTIAAYVSQFTSGQETSDFSSYFGITLTRKQLCRLYGTWSCREYGIQRSPASLCTDVLTTS